MVDEREDDNYDGEEGEYHFSDDQVNYEIEPPEVKSNAPSANPVATLLSKMTPARKAVMGAIVFIILLSVVFKMLRPSSAPSTEFSQTTVAKAKPAIVKPPVANSQPVTMPQPIQQPTPSMPTEMAHNPVSPPTQPAMQPPSTQPIPVATNTSELQQSPMTPPPAQLPESQPAGLVQTMPPPPVTPISAVPTDVVERLATLEQDNAEIQNVLRTSYAQKMSAYDTQDAAMANKMDELTQRVNHMEASLNQISQMLQNLNRAPMASGLMDSSAAPSHPREIRSIFTVQAIIPGRAWLKSDAGDTVTVAEGDILKNVGRITKIDPYDGIVNIDTGNKIVTLSYGVSAD